MAARACRRATATGVLCALLAVTVVGCAGSRKDAAEGQPPEVVVASFAFAESDTLASSEAPMSFSR